MVVSDCLTACLYIMLVYVSGSRWRGSKSDAFGLFFCISEHPYEFYAHTVNLTVGFKLLLI
jgi:hypothetical protein